MITGIETTQHKRGLGTDGGAIDLGCFFKIM
jgi:hypothetical protein